jgi:hypothetical protein
VYDLIKIIIDLPDIYGYHKQFEELENNIENNIDIILANIRSTSQVYKFKSGNKYIYLFSTSMRKRKGQLVKLIEKNLIKKEIIESYTVFALLKSEFHQYLEDFKNNEKFVLTDKPVNFDGYSGNDLLIFNNKENWHPWQKDIYNILFHRSGRLKNANEREIIALYDEKGNCGKSSFFKYLYYHHSNEIGRITYGTASQLRTSISNMGPKKIYIMDLTRSKAKNDSEVDLLSAVEDLKNGLITSSMYGEGKTMLMDIPHVIISSNYIFDITLVSEDRWKILSITEDKKTKDITQSVKRKMKRKDLVKK